MVPLDAFPPWEDTHLQARAQDPEIGNPDDLMWLFKSDEDASYGDPMDTPALGTPVVSLPAASPPAKAAPTAPRPQSSFPVPKTPSPGKLPSTHPAKASLTMTPTKTPRVISETEALLRMAKLPPKLVMIPSPDQAAGIQGIMTKITEHFQATGAWLRARSEREPTFFRESTEDGSEETSEAAPPESQVPEKAIVVTMTGPAGTGKTTLLQVVLRQCSWSGLSVQVLAPTGKAVARIREVLREDPALAGYVESARTMHSYVYGGPTECAQCPKCQEWSTDLVETPQEGADFRRCPHCRESLPLGTLMEHRLDWVPPGIEEAPTFLILAVDEGSMVGPRMHTHLLNGLGHGCVVLYFADKAQLPPILDESEVQEYPGRQWGPDLDNPTVSLTKVHRQAEGSPLIQYLTAVRNGNILTPPLKGHGWSLPSDPTSIRGYDWCELQAAVDWLVAARREKKSATMVCYTNATRKTMNIRVRDALGLSQAAAQTGVPIQPGDILIVRGNGGRYFNGEMLDVTASKLTYWTLFTEYNERKGTLTRGPDLQVVELTVEGSSLPVYVLPEGIGMDYSRFRDLRVPIQRSFNILQRYADGRGISVAALAEQEHCLSPQDILPVDWGQVITAHVSQGSQWDHGGVLWERACWGMWSHDRATGIRWLYTAASRFKKSLSLFSLAKGQT